MTLSDTTTPSQSGHGSDGNEEVLHIPQNSNITGAKQSNCLVSYLEQLLGWGVILLQSVYSIAVVDLATVLFDPYIRPYRVRADLEAMAMKG